MLKVLVCLLPVLISVKAEVFTLTHNSQCHSIPVSIVDICTIHHDKKGLNAPFDFNVTCNSTNQKIWFGLSSKSSDDIFDSIEPHIIYSTQFYFNFHKSMDLAEMYRVINKEYCLPTIYLVTCTHEFTGDVSVTISYNYDIIRYMTSDDIAVFVVMILLICTAVGMCIMFIIINCKKPNNAQPPQRLQEAETDSEPEEDTSLNRVSRVELMERHIV